MDGAVATGADANQPRAVDGGQGVTWWTDAWALFTKNAVIWVVLGLVLFIILLVLAFIPIVGQLASALLLPPGFSVDLTGDSVTAVGRTQSSESVFDRGCFGPGGAGGPGVAGGSTSPFRAVPHYPARGRHALADTDRHARSARRRAELAGRTAAGHRDLLPDPNQRR